MDSAIAQIIVSVITVCVPTLATLVTTKSVKKQNNKHNTRSNIMQLIIEDHVRVAEKQLPENRQVIHEEYDEYIASGGNSYIHKKVDEYEIWFDKVTKELTKKH